jgi:hypothetical protein
MEGDCLKGLDVAGASCPGPADESTFVGAQERRAGLGSVCIYRGRIPRLHRTEVPEPAAKQEAPRIDVAGASCPGPADESTFVGAQDRGAGLGSVYVYRGGAPQLQRAAGRRRKISPAAPVDATHAWSTPSILLRLLRLSLRSWTRADGHQVLRGRWGAELVARGVHRRREDFEASARTRAPDRAVSGGFRHHASGPPRGGPGWRPRGRRGASRR